MGTVCYWDSETNEQRERDETPGELAERMIRVNAPAPVPQRIPMLNAHLVLIDAGWFDDVLAYLASIPGPDGQKARAYFDKALTMERNNPLVLGIPAALGKTDAEVDALFTAADALIV
ncbi:MAG: hypothetical protein V4641_20610 [Pseudomonadota bacterium]